MVKNYRKRILILGGDGALGSRIAQLLSDEANLQLIIAGCDKLRTELCASALPGIAESLYLEPGATDLGAQLKMLQLDLLIYCASPYQTETDYRVARACIESNTPYLDTASARRFVCDFNRLSAEAEATGTALISGAAILPALSSAALREIQRELPNIHTVEFATVIPRPIERSPAINHCASLGERFPQLQNGQWRESYAGNQLRRIKFAHPIGECWLCDSDVPDLELCPRHFPELHSARFAAGVQSRALQANLALCAHLAQWNLPFPAIFPDLGRKLVRCWPGDSGHGGMLVRATGHDTHGTAAAYQWQILGLNGDSPWIAAAPAAAMARKLLRNKYAFTGARACWQQLDLDEILAELTPYSVVSATERLESTRLRN